MEIDPSTKAVRLTKEEITAIGSPYLDAEQPAGAVGGLVNRAFDALNEADNFDPTRFPASPNRTHLTVENMRRGMILRDLIIELAPIASEGKGEAIGAAAEAFLKDQGFNI